MTNTKGVDRVSPRMGDGHARSSIRDYCRSRATSGTCWFVCWSVCFAR